jgi:hypothetical protein
MLTMNIRERERHSGLNSAGFTHGPWRAVVNAVLKLHVS